MTNIERAAAEPRTSRTRTQIDTGWTFRRVGDAEWLPAQVPGSNFTDLLRNGAIENPFDGDAELRLQWIEREDWEYRCAFHVPEAELSADSVELVFEGLDTYCTVELNGAPILESANMFCAHRVDCKALLRPGANELRLLFQSPVTRGAARRASEGLLYPAENDKTEDHVSVYVRKAPYHFGWDWGPKYVPSGVWRPVWLETARKGHIRALSHHLLSLDDDRAEIAFTIDLEGYAAREAWIEIDCDVAGVAPVRVPVMLAKGRRRREVRVTIDRPRRWWPNGLGEPFLYRFTLRLIAGAVVLDEAKLAIGLRTIEVVNRPDEHGESFYLRVNGRPVFMKGANYIPPDSFQESITPERYRRLFRDTVAANMNMLRVWGGGVYERDLFYDLADEHGILIWQDFMFACTLYPSDREFLDQVAEEATQAVRRLRDHACLALWCGNNEISLGIAGWEWPAKFGYSDAQFAEMVAGNRRLFEQLLPAIVAEQDPGRFYLPSSPIGDWNNPTDDGHGNGHYWGVWHGELPFSTYAERVPRFMTEYGFQSYPLLASIDAFTRAEDRSIESAVLGVHQKHPRGNAIIARFIRETFGEPASFEHFCYLSQVLQAEGLRVAFEAHRRAMPFCMGSLYWQLDDCWPSISWSSIDYFGRWKALHYQAARSFAPFLLSAEQRDGAIHVHGVSDRIEDTAATLEVAFVDVNGGVLWQATRDVELPGNRAGVLYTMDAGTVAQIDPRSAVLVLRLVGAEEILATTIVHPEHEPGSVLPDPGLRAEAIDQRSVCVHTRRFARAVFVSADPADGDDAPLQFEDNFFDLLPGETRVVATRDGRPFDPATLRLLSVHDAVLPPLDQAAGGTERTAASRG